MGSGNTCPMEEEVEEYHIGALPRKLFDEFIDDNIPPNEDIQKNHFLNDKDDNDIDSDYEEDDDEHYTTERMARKGTRHKIQSITQQNTELHKMERNSRIIERFEKYINNKKIDTNQNPSKLSTLVKHKGHLFSYHDSLLSFETNKDPLFNLERLTNSRVDSHGSARICIDLYIITALLGTFAAPQHRSTAAPQNRLYTINRICTLGYISMVLHGSALTYIL